jgi:hypothetical protein
MSEGARPGGAADQVAELLDAAGSTRYAPLFELLVHTGLRRGEALALRWADVDLDRGMLRVRGTLARIDGALVVTEPKTAKSNRFVPISAPAEHLLQDVRGSQAAERLRAGSAWHETGFVFTTETGDPCDPRNALRAFKVAAARAGLPDAGLHTLRHSAASAMLSHGVPLKAAWRQRCRDGQVLRRRPRDYRSRLTDQTSIPRPPSLVAELRGGRGIEPCPDGYPFPAVGSGSGSGASGRRGSPADH